MNHSHGRLVSLGCLILLLTGCVSVGRDFPTPTQDIIRNGVTTGVELLQRFGSPTQVGIENGDQTWSWVYVRAGGLGQPLSKQLHVKFDDRGIVKSYSYTSSLPEEVQQKTR